MTTNDDFSTPIQPRHPTPPSVPTTDDDYSADISMYSINVRKLTMEDYYLFDANQGNPGLPRIVEMLARCTGHTAEHIWKLDVLVFAKLREAFLEAMSNIVKKANAGS